MATLDITNHKEEEVDCIVFAQKSSSYYKAMRLTRGGSKQTVLVEDDENVKVIIETEEDAKNLIKAINKAIALGWWK